MGEIISYHPFALRIRDKLKLLFVPTQGGGMEIIMLQNRELLCPRCATGKKDYELDEHSIFCRHINCLKNGKCSKFEQLKIIETHKVV